MVIVAMGLLSAGCRKPAPTFKQTGGTVLVYEIEGENWGKASEEERLSLPLAVLRRADPESKLGIESALDGQNRLSVSIPGQDDKVVERVERLLALSGQLELLIVANEIDHSKLIEKARQTKEQIVKEGDVAVGRWVPVGKEWDGSKAHRVRLIGNPVRDAATKNAISFPKEIANRDDPKGQGIADWLADKGIENVEMLLVLDRKPALNIDGRHFASVQSSFDETASPCVNFTMTKEGAILLSLITTENSPDASTGHMRLLGIVFDGEIVTAPRIQSAIGGHGRITGRFTQQEVNEMVAVMRARLPFPLSKVPVNKVQVEGTKK